MKIKNRENINFLAEPLENQYPTHLPIGAEGAFSQDHWHKNYICTRRVEILFEKPSFCDYPVKNNSSIIK